jgi:hypothetical protein
MENFLQKNTSIQYGISFGDNVLYRGARDITRQRSRVVERRLYISQIHEIANFLIARAGSGSFFSAQVLDPNKFLINFLQGIFPFHLNFTKFTTPLSSKKCSHKKRFL